MVQKKIYFLKHIQAKIWYLLCRQAILLQNCIQTQKWNLVDSQMRLKKDVIPSHCGLPEGSKIPLLASCHDTYQTGWCLFFSRLQGRWNQGIRGACAPLQFFYRTDCELCFIKLSFASLCPLRFFYLPPALLFSILQK